jgi:hypothetical protein
VAGSDPQGPQEFWRAKRRAKRGRSRPRNLRNKAALRGAEGNGNEAAAVLPPAPLNLSIYLPTGSEPGDYEVQVTRGSGQPLLKAQGQARLRDHIAVLDLKLDLQQLQPGLYLFWIRQVGSSWSYYPVFVREPKSIARSAFVAAHKCAGQKLPDVDSCPKLTRQRGFEPHPLSCEGNGLRTSGFDRL